MRFFQKIVLTLQKVKQSKVENMSIKKWLYVAEILLEVAKTILPYVKARKISIDSDQPSEDDLQSDDK